MVRAKIIGKPAREGDKVVGKIRYTSEDGKMLGEYHFSESVAEVATMTTEEFEDHAIRKMRSRLKAAKLEKDWARVQALLDPLVEEEA